MPDRIIRDDLLDSTRWLDLPTDSHRLVFIALITKADDYGNCEGGSRRLFRWMHGFTQVKSEADAIKLMSDLQDADLTRRYEVAGKEFWHIPRFRNSRRYWSRKYPKSPFPENSTIPTNQQDVKKIGADLPQTCANPSRGVGVGVGVGVGDKALASRAVARSAVALLPLADKTEFPITQELIDEWTAAYPAVDVALTLREIRAWCISNPTKRKTRTGAARFINAWLAKEQNRG